MDRHIKELALTLENKTIQRRRDFHKYAEAAWTEFRTAAIVADTLNALGYEVLIGNETVATEAMMGVPAPEALTRHMERAVLQGANPKWVE